MPAPAPSPATEPARPRPAERIFYLDALRAFCMFFGVLSHGATIGVGDEPLFIVLKDMSGLFRMVTFFVVAGFFTCLVYEKTSWPEYWRSRVILILLPLATTLVTVIPGTNYLIHVWHNGPMSLQHYFLERGWAEPSRGNDVWHLHLWFLFALFAYAMATPLLVAAIRSAPARAGLAAFQRLTAGWTLWAMAIGIALAVAVLRGLYRFALNPLIGDTVIGWLVQTTFAHAPWFVLGLVLFVDRQLFRTAHRIDWLALALVASLYVATIAWGGALPYVAERLLYWLSRSCLIMLIIAALIRIFELHFNKPSRALSFFVDGAFSFYLFHLSFIYIVANLVGPALDNIILTFLVIVATVPPLVLLLHARVIAPVPVLRLLYNGKRQRRLPAPAVPGDTLSGLPPPALSAYPPGNDPARHLDQRPRKDL